MSARQPRSPRFARLAKPPPAPGPPASESVHCVPARRASRGSLTPHPGDSSRQGPGGRLSDPMPGAPSRHGPAHYSPIPTQHRARWQRSESVALVGPGTGCLDRRRRAQGGIRRGVGASRTSPSPRAIVTRNTSGGHVGTGVGGATVRLRPGGYAGGTPISDYRRIGRSRWLSRETSVYHSDFIRAETVQLVDQTIDPAVERVNLSLDRLFLYRDPATM